MMRYRLPWNAPKEGAWFDGQSQRLVVGALIEHRKVKGRELGHVTRRIVDVELCYYLGDQGGPIADEPDSERRIDRTVAELQSAGPEGVERQIAGRFTHPVMLWGERPIKWQDRRVVDLGKFGTFFGSWNTIEAFPVPQPRSLAEVA